MKQVNIIVGRFQPFTKGHMKCVEEAWNKLKVPTVIVMIDTPDNKVDKKHQFPSSLLLKIYNILFEDNKMIDHIMLSKNANIVEIGKTLYEKGYEIVSWTCGTDRVQSYSKMVNNYKEDAHLADDFQLLEIKRTDEDISATKVRNALLENDKQTFYKLIPNVNLKSSLKINIYDTLREQILTVYK